MNLLATPSVPATTLETLRTLRADAKLSLTTCDNIEHWLRTASEPELLDPVVRLIDAQDLPALEAAFWEVIAFGTGGRRGVMGDFGTATINRRTVAESACGLAIYLKRQRAAARVVVAHDTRNRSREFAELSAEVLAGAGCEVFLFESFRATPELAFAVRHLNCDAGIMISASHNPPADNGIKVYGAHGGQVIPPDDAGIIQAVSAVSHIERMPLADGLASGQIKPIGAAVDAAYQQSVMALSLSGARDVAALYSPLHGVGMTSVVPILRTLGFHGLQTFAVQCIPDGNFPTVPQHLANPEFANVYGPLYEAAAGKEFDVLLASDPDADRLGVAVRNDEGKYVQLTGNQIAALVVDHVLRQRAQTGVLTREHYVSTTLVTTPLVRQLGEAAGVTVIDDMLVGIKYLAALVTTRGPQHFLCGCEESLGFIAGGDVRDKDAALTAMYVLELAAELRNSGQTLFDRLDDIALAHGVLAERQMTRACVGPSGRRDAERIMLAFRDNPPTQLAGIPLEIVRDYQRHETRALPQNSVVSALPEPRGNLLVFESWPEELSSATRLRFAVRPSGTEPKIKFYVFVQRDCPGQEGLPAVRRELAELLEKLETELQAWMRQVA